MTYFARMCVLFGQYWLIRKQLINAKGKPLICLCLGLLLKPSLYHSYECNPSAVYYMSELLGGALT